jgi:predicted RNA-binding protein YlxR (DUF448 family)
MPDPAPETLAEVQAKTHAEASRQRRDLVSGAVMEEARLIRFVAAPDGTVTPDLGRKLPGRGMWVEATRAAVDQAARKGGFSRSAKAKLNAPHNLSDQVETLLARQCLDRLGLARRAGALTSGFEKVSSLVSSGKAVWLIEASDGAADGRRKLLGLARRSPKPPQVCGAFDADELSLALGLGHAIHTAFSAGRWAERWSEALSRLAGFRPILPERWSEEAHSE